MIQSFNMTREDLEQIGKLIETKLEAERGETRKLFETEREYTRQLVRQEIEAEREHTRKLIREETQEVKTEILTAIKREAQTMADFFHDTWERMDSSEERVTRLEKHTGLTSPHKN